METDKEKILTVIKEWIIMDNEIKKLQNVMKERKEKKKMLTNVLVTEMNKSNVDEYNTQNGKLIKTCKKSKKPISKSYLSRCIEKIFKNNPDQGNQILEFIHENREINVKENIKFK